MPEGSCLTTEESMNNTVRFTNHCRQTVTNIKHVLFLFDAQTVAQNHKHIINIKSLKPFMDKDYSLRKRLTKQLQSQKKSAVTQCVTADCIVLRK